MAKISILVALIGLSLSYLGVAYNVGWYPFQSKEEQLLISQQASLASNDGFAAYNISDNYRMSGEIRNAYAWCLIAACLRYGSNHECGSAYWPRFEDLTQCNAALQTANSTLGPYGKSLSSCFPDEVIICPIRGYIIE